MAKRKQRKSTKTGAKKHACESRVFRKLAQSLAASQLSGLESLPPHPPTNANHHHPSGEATARSPQRRFRWRATAAPAPNATGVHHDGHNQDEHDDVDRVRASLVERAHVRALRTVLSKRARAAVRTKKPPRTSALRSRSVTTTTTTTTTGVLQFQPATFTLVPSTADLVNEAAATLNGVALQEVLAPPQQHHHQWPPPAVSLPTNPSLTVFATATTQQQPHTCRTNRFQSLQQDDDDDDLLAWGQQKSLRVAPTSFAFQPASFFVPTTTTTSYNLEEIDPDL